MIRLFVSSTFADFRAERELLRRCVFPHLEQVALEHGSTFQAIDLRWGVSRAAAEDQLAMAICLQEIDRCRDTGVGPCFLALVGDRYGWCPLPAVIPELTFEQLVRALKSETGQENHLRHLKQWYRRDSNAVPPSMVLRPRQRHHAAWSPVERDLQIALRRATRSWPDQDRLSLIASATEQEIGRGIFSSDVAVRAWCVLRRIAQRPRKSRKAAFADEDQSSFAVARLERLRDRVKAVVRPRALEYETTWSRGAPGRDYLTRFTNDLTAALSGAIVGALKGRAAVSALADEMAAHERFRRSLIADANGQPCFVGRRRELGAIEAYLRSGDVHPLVVHGPGGVGKSALIAQAIDRPMVKRPESVVIHRFAGTTPESASLRTLLASLCAQLRSITTAPEPPTRDRYQDLVADFSRLLRSAGQRQSVAIFLDAIDQLRDIGDPPQLDWVPRALPHGVRLVISVLKGPLFDAIHRHLAASRVIQVPPMPARDGEALLRTWLRRSGRALQPRQRLAIERRFTRSGLPLYLRLAFEEARRWRSFDRPVVARDLDGMVGQLMDRLAQPVAHGTVLVRRSMAYLLASREGLADEEALGLLSRDREVVADFAQRMPDSPQTRELPPILWSRLYFDLQPYLSTVAAGAARLLRFFHREFAEAIARRYADRSRHESIANYFASRGLHLGSGMNAPANERTLTELPYQLSSARQDRQLRALLSDYDFIDTKVGAFGPQPIIEDYALLKVDRDAVDLRPLLLALESSAHVLQRDRAQTAPQLVARLGAEGSGPVADLVSAATAWRGRPWLRPLRASLVASGPVLRTLVNPVEHINDIAFAPSGRFLVTCANEPVVRVWDAHSGVQLRTLEGHSEWVKCVAVLPDERTVLSGSFDSTIRLWDLDAHHEPVVHNTGGRVWSLALLPGGRHAVVGAGERVQLWDLQRGKVLRDGIGHSEEVTALAVTSDGKTVLSLSEDRTVRVWEIASMKCVRTHRGEDVDPQRRWKETGDGGKRSAHPEWTPYALALTHDGRSFLAARRDESIRMRSVATGVEMAKFVGHDGTVDCVAVDRAGSIVVSGGWDRTLRTWGLDGTQQRSFTHTNESIGPIVFPPHQSDVVYTGAGDGKVLVWELTAPPPATTTAPHHPTEVTAVHATRNRLISADRDGRVFVWDARTGRRHFEFRTDGSISALATSHDGRTLFVTGLGKYGRTTESCRLRARPHLEYLSFLYGGTSDFRQLLVTPDGRRLIGCGLDTTGVLDIDGGRFEHELDIHSRWIAIAPDGRHVIGDGKDGICRVPIAGGRREVLLRLGDEVWTAVLLPDGRTLVCFGPGNGTELWSFDGPGRPARKPLATLPGEAVGGAVSANGRWLVTFNRRSQLVWWDLSTRTAVARFDGVGAFTACAVTPDGSTVIAGEDTGRIHLLRAESPTFSNP